VPGFEDQLEGAAAGDERTVDIDFPDDYPADELAGKPAEFEVTVKEIKAKELPELDDELAAEAGFDTLDELREDIRERLAETQRTRLEAEYREAALDSVVEGATVEIPDALVEARARELWDQMIHSLSHQGIDRATYLRITGREEADIVEEGKPDAEQALRREAVLAAIVEAEGIEPTEAEIMEAVESAAPAEGMPAKKLYERLRSAGRLEQLQDDLAQRKALDLVAETARPITVEEARKRGKLYTKSADAPESEDSEADTPAS
jgi:trigger factor